MVQYQTSECIGPSAVRFVQLDYGLDYVTVYQRTTPQSHRLLEVSDMHATLRINGFDVSNIRNRNERRVAELIPAILEEQYSDYLFEQLDIEDIYALSLNLLPARYVQKGSIIISERLSNYEIRQQIINAVERVIDNPTRAEKD